MAKTIRVAVVGLGIGKFHIAAALKHPQVELIAVADADPSKEVLLRQILQEAGHVAPVSFYTNPAEMYEKEDLDAVSICTPNFTHADLFVEALRAGLHVLTEKPLSDTFNDARHMGRTAAVYSDLVTAIMQNNLHRPIIRQLKEALASIGSVMQLEVEWLRPHGIPLPRTWFSDKSKSGGGPLVDLGPHGIGVVLDLLDWPAHGQALCSTYSMHGAPEAWVGPYADGLIGTGTFDVETVASGILLLDDELITPVNFRFSWAEPVTAESFRIKAIGNNGAVEASCIWQAVDKDNTAVKQLVYVRSECDRGHNCIAQVIAEGAQLTEGDDTNGRVENVLAFYDHILGNPAPVIVTIEQGLTIQRIIEAAYVSAVTHNLVRFG